MILFFFLIAIFFYFSFSSFYKGILPPILVETPKRATKFFTFEQYKRAFSFGGTAPDWLVSYH